MLWNNESIGDVITLKFVEVKWVILISKIESWAIKNSYNRNKNFRYQLSVTVV